MLFPSVPQYGWLAEKLFCRIPGTVSSCIVAFLSPYEPTLKNKPGLLWTMPRLLGAAFTQAPVDPSAK